LFGGWHPFEMCQMLLAEQGFEESASHLENDGNGFLP